MSLNLLRRFALAGLIALVGVVSSVPTGAFAADAGGGVEQVPVVCGANYLDEPAEEPLSIGILTPDFPPFWDLLPPVGSYAFATGVAVFTPSGQVNVVCHDNPSDDGSPVWGPPPFTGSANCFTARGGDPEDVNGSGAKLYGGRGTVVVNEGHVVITCHMTFQGIQP